MVKAWWSSLRGAGAPPLALAQGVFVVAFLARISHLWALRDQVFLWKLQTEPARYVEWAQALLDGHPPPLPFDSAPGYPLFLSLLLLISAGNLVAVYLCQVILDSLSAVLITRVISHTISRRCGLVAGALWAGLGPAIYYVAEVLPVTVFVFLLLATIQVAEHPPRRLKPGSVQHWAAAGLLLALAVSLRSEALLLLPGLLWRACRGGSWRRGLSAGLAPLAYLVLMTSLNYQQTHRLLPTHLGFGLNVWLGNHPAGDGVTPFLTEQQQRDAVTMLRHARGNPVDADRAMLSESVTAMAAHPAAAAARFWKKLVWALNQRELPNTSDIEWQLNHSPLFVAPVLPWGMGIVLPLALVGLVLPRSERSKAIRWWVYSLLLMGLFTCVAFLSNSRFRAALYPGLVGAGSLGCCVLFQAGKQARRTPVRVAYSLALLAVGAGICWNDYRGVKSYRIAEIDANTAVIELKTGNLEAAVLRFRRSLDTKPDMSLTWKQLARALKKAGCEPEAQRVWAAAHRTRRVAHEGARQTESPEFCRRAARKLPVPQRMNPR